MKHAFVHCLFIERRLTTYLPSNNLLNTSLMILLRSTVTFWWCVAK